MPNDSAPAVPRPRPRAALLALAVLVTLLAHPPGASAASYFVSPDGDDAAAGTSPEGAWKSLGFAGARTYRPGDVLRLEGGETYTGTLAFGEDDGGDPDEPVTVASYGPGRATIRAAAGPGVSIYNAGGFALRDLHVVGPRGERERHERRERLRRPPG